jgi:hypothetical protein
MPRKRLFPPTHAPTGQRLESKGRAEHTVLTVNGRLTLWRRRWFSPASGSLTPLDALLDAAEATLTVGVRELACRLNQASRNFDKAAENLARAAQVALSGEFLRQVVEAEGQAVLKAQRSGALAIGWTAAACLIPAGAAPTAARAAAAAAGPPPLGRPVPAETGVPALPAAAAPAAAGTRLYLGCDGVKVPLITEAEKQTRRRNVKQKRRRRGKTCRPLPRPQPGADQRYKEFRIVTFYDETQAHRHVAVTQGDHEVVGRLMRREAGRVRLDQAADKVAVVDGAPWIRNQLQAQSLPLDGIELDFYHLADNVHKARRLVYGEEAEPGQAWAAGVLHTAKHHGYGALRDQLVAWKGTLRGGKRRKAAAVLLDYVTDRRTMVEYPEYLAAGRQIGSGPTESMCKTTTARLKGVGMRWQGDNAEAIMALDALEQSGEWQRYWEGCLKPAA